MGEAYIPYLLEKTLRFYCIQSERDAGCILRATLFEGGCYFTQRQALTIPSEAHTKRDFYQVNKGRATLLFIRKCRLYSRAGSTAFKSLWVGLYLRADSIRVNTVCMYWLSCKHQTELARETLRKSFFYRYTCARKNRLMASRNSESGTDEEFVLYCDGLWLLSQSYKAIQSWQRILHGTSAQAFIDV